MKSGLGRITCFLVFAGVLITIAQAQELTTGPAESAETTGVVFTKPDEVTTSTAGHKAETTSTTTDQSTATIAQGEATTVTLEKGVQARDLVIGTGPAITTTSTRVIHFYMWLDDGRMINSTRTEMYPLPFKFTPGREEAIRGMEIGTEGMRVGGKRLLVIPPEAGYGKEGSGDVPADATLTYEVELVGTL